MNVIPIGSAREEVTDPILEVFTHWQIIMGKRRARLDEKRKTTIKARFKDGYSVTDLCDAINGNYLSPFHQGDNVHGTVYNDLCLIIRDAEHVDRFIGFYEEGQEKLTKIQQVQEKAPEQVSTAEFARSKLEQIKKLMRR